MMVAAPRAEVVGRLAGICSQARAGLAAERAAVAAAAAAANRGLRVLAAPEAH